MSAEQGRSEPGLKDVSSPLYSTYTPLMLFSEFTASWTISSMRWNCELKNTDTSSIDFSSASRIRTRSSPFSVAIDTRGQSWSAEP